MKVIYEWPIWVPILVILLLSLGAGELGFRRGRAQQVGESERDILTTVRTATLGLVALLLGFSFAVTSGRFNDRSRLVMDEANAIGTCYLRAGLVAEPASGEIRGARRYIDVRIESYERGVDRREFVRLADQMHATLTELWTGVTHAVSADRQIALASAIVRWARRGGGEWFCRWASTCSSSWWPSSSSILIDPGAA